jgi:cytochrome c oxidase subunit 2
MTSFFRVLKKFSGSLFPAASISAMQMNRLFFEFLLAAGAIMILIIFLVLFAAIRFRSEKRPEIPPQISGNTRLEMMWTIIPGLLIAFFFILTIRAIVSINKDIPDHHPPDLVIVAHQWWWEISYPDYKVRTANELHIPIKRKFYTVVESADVVHDWWVPALGRKIDAIPGHSNYTWIEADTPGDYEGACSEFCGMQHAWMRIKVIAEADSDFKQWIASQKKAAVHPTDSLAVQGEAYFQEKSCANCHRISGTNASAEIGPDLSHIASRQTILSGMLPNNRKNLERWLRNPQKVKEGANMPDFRLTGLELKSLVQYLEELK